MDFCMRIASDLILQKISEGSSSNVVLSPMSITVVLNLVASGSHGETLAQFLNVLDSNDTQELNSVSEQILSLFAPAAADDTSSSSPSPPLPHETDYPFPGLLRAHSPQPPRPQPLDFGLFNPHGPFFTPPPVAPSMNSYDFYMPPPWQPHSVDFASRYGASNRGKQPVFSMANALWVDHGWSLKPSFIQVSDSVYKALVKNVDLRRELLDFSTNTNGLIKELLSKDVTLTPPLCLANALHFKGTWRTPFHVSETHDQYFHLLNGQTTKVPFMMQRNEYYGYASFEEFKLVQLPYKQGQSTSKRFSMYIFLPHARDGLKSLAAKLKSDPSTLQPKKFILPRKKLSHLLIPKLKFTSDFDAIELMNSHGLTLPFDGGADFVNMVHGGNVYVAILLHKAFIEVNEEGTEAAAVTFLCMAQSCARMPPEPMPSFVADHPFLFMIVEDVSGNVVFSGAVLNPLSK